MGFSLLRAAVAALCAMAAFATEEVQEYDRLNSDTGLQKRSLDAEQNWSSPKFIFKRQTCAYYTCPSGSCANSASDRCCPVRGYCYSTQACCQDGCITFGSECCLNGNGCFPGTHCCNDEFGGCCEDGDTCNSLTGRCRPGGGLTGTAGNGGVTPTSVTTTTRTTVTVAPASRYYYYYYTWWYYSWYYKYDFTIRFSTVTSTRTTTSTRLSVYAAASSEADSSWEAISATFATPDPPFSATRLSASASEINAAASASAAATATSETAAPSTRRSATSSSSSSSSAGSGSGSGAVSGAMAWRAPKPWVLEGVLGVFASIVFGLAVGL